MCFFQHPPLHRKRLTLICALVGKQPGRLRSSLACKDLSSLSKPWERSTNITNAGGGVGHFSISSLKKWRLEANMLQLTDHVPLVQVQTWLTWPFEKRQPQNEFFKLMVPNPLNAGVPQQQRWIFWGILIYSTFKNAEILCEHNWWYSSMSLEKTNVYKCGFPHKKYMLRTNQKSRTLLRWHWELKICDNIFCQLSLMIGESLKIYILGSCHPKKNAKVTQTIISQTFPG